MHWGKMRRLGRRCALEIVNLRLASAELADRALKDAMAGHVLFLFFTRPGAGLAEEFRKLDLLASCAMCSWHCWALLYLSAVDASMFLLLLAFTGSS